MKRAETTNFTLQGSEPRNHRYIVPAVDRAIRILSLLKSRELGMTIAEIAEATGWHKSTVHKLLVTLNHHGLLDRDERTKEYSLGIALSEYGRIALNRADILHAAKSFLKSLVEYSGETALLAVLRETQMVIVDVEEAPGLLRASPAVGTKSPATITSNGKAVMAYLPENQFKEILQAEGLTARTPKSITRIGAYRIELAAIRKCGFAVDNEEYDEGIVAVSAPIFGSGKLVMGALSVVGPAFRMAKDKTRRYGKKCAEMSAQLSALLR